MECPRCDSSRIQRGYKDSFILFRLARLQELLCNNCGLEFRGFDVFGRWIRAPSTGRSVINRRGSPRYRAHLPATINPGHREPGSGKVIFPQATRGHCESISKIGLEVSFVGLRFGPEEFSEPGRLLLVSVVLSNGPIDAVVSTVTHVRQEAEGGLPRWYVGGSITQMSDTDRERLAVYLKKRAEREPPINVE
jgi:hypothetical protein